LNKRLEGFFGRNLEPFLFAAPSQSPDMRGGGMEKIVVATEGVNAKCRDIAQSLAV